MLGSTGASVGAVSLGGEGVLRSDWPNDEGVAMIGAALARGVTYCDTAPAYADSERCYGAALRAAGPGARDRIFLASKTHLRDREGAARLLDASLERLGTDHLDLWQLHDLRFDDDLDEIFGPGGAIEAVRAAKDDGRVRHVGITGHFDPAVLVAAMGRYDFDVVLAPINPADAEHAPFIPSVVAEARRRSMGVVAMKVFARGRMLEDGVASPDELIRYALAFADTCILGCANVSEVEQNLALGERAVAMEEPERRELERRVAGRDGRYDYFKG